MKKIMVALVALMCVAGFIGIYVWVKSSTSDPRAQDPVEPTQFTPTQAATADDQIRSPDEKTTSVDDGQSVANSQEETAYPTEANTFYIGEMPDDIILRGLDPSGDIGDFHEAYREIQAAISRMKAGKLDISELSALIDGYEFNSDWMLFLRIDTKKRLGLPLSSEESRYYARARNWITTFLRNRWNANVVEVRRLIKPIRDTLTWAEENAPSEHKLLSGRYLKTVRERSVLPVSIERYITTEERTDRLYNFFFEALSELPADARVFTEYWGGGRKVPPPPPLRVDISPSPPFEAPRQKAPADVHSSGGSSPPSNTPSDKTPAVESSMPDDPAAFESAVLASIERYGLHEGLQLLAASHPAWAERLVMWAQERQNRQLPPLPSRP